MAEFLSLQQAVERNLNNGDTVAFEGFTHLIPYASAHEAIRQKTSELTIVRMTPDIVYDQMIGMNCARKIVFSFSGNPGVGLLNRFRDAVEKQWPAPLVLEEYSHAAMANAYEAGAAGLPFAVFRSSQESELNRVNKNIKIIRCPFTNEALTAVPAIKPDVCFIHAQMSNSRGDILIEGITGVQKEVALASKRVVVTVEDVVDEFTGLSPNACILPSWTVDAVVKVPGGAHPSYTHGVYQRDNAFYKKWNKIAEDRSAFLEWMDKNVLNVDETVFASRVAPLMEEA